MSKFYQGEYTLINKEKYIGQKNPIFRSSWERRVFHYFDTNINVIEWSSESIVIPYFFPIDGKNHRYFPDIYCKVKNREGEEKEFIIEIKPKSQSIPPTTPKRKTSTSMKNFRNAQIIYLQNKYKWDSAKRFCDKKGWEFKVLTEEQIFNENV